MTAESGARRSSKALTALQVRADLEPGKYHDGGGLGLYLRVEKNGTRFWVQRVTIGGARRELGLGSPPLITLAAAREKATENKRLILSGGNPLLEKQKARGALTFAEASERYLAAKLTEFKNEKHQKQWRSTLETYAYPVLAARPVGSIEVADLLRVLQPIWSSKSETASRLRGRVEAVLAWATVSGFRSGDNPARWGGNLAELLPKQRKGAAFGNQPALALADVQRWFCHLSARRETAALALRFLAMTACRSGEVRGMTWAEVSGEIGEDAIAAKDAIWTIPADRMKMGRTHRVPMTADTITLLQIVTRVDYIPLVFIAPGGGMLSDMALTAVMRRMSEADEKQGGSGFRDPRSGRVAVPHGLRSTFRDWAAEQGVDRDLAEMALAHDVGSAVERAYRRSDMFERRRGLLKRWQGFLTG
ncbi:MAG: integrase arm-type DNA-binding domain-containing protein [Bauldia sp.]|nr:integrase arm-type DNA-binding domain-containing protein [Bauldia sp.]MCW5716731.1 integrase arm-type DNA-binding domain-containing protein [Bauldia sp.]